MPVQRGDDGGRVYLAWRGLELASPPRLEPIGRGVDLEIGRRWREEGHGFLRLRDPATGRTVDYRVRGTSPTREKAVGLIGDRAFVLPELPPGWPGEVQPPPTLVAMERPSAVRTLDLDEIGGALAFSSPTEFEDVLGVLPDWQSPEARADEIKLREERGGPDRPTFCVACNKPVGDTDATCSHCGVSRQAPLCPHCGAHVSDALDHRNFYLDENGYYPWHEAWDAHCQGCGFAFSARLQLACGHTTFFDERSERPPSPDVKDPNGGRSIIEIDGGESVFVRSDEWD